MTFDGNADPLTTVWSSKSCTTEYQDSGLLCRCSTLNNHYIGIVDDFTRVKQIESFFDLDFQWPLLFIIYPMLIFAICGPLIAYFLDRESFKEIQADAYYLTDSQVDDYMS